MGHVYLLTSPSGKQYVGMTKHTAEERWERHVKDSTNSSWSALHAAIRKYGSENFKVETLEAHESREALALAEKRLIAQLGTKFPLGYNLTDGGEGAPCLPDDVEKRRVERSAQTRKGLKLSDAHRKALSEAHMGLPSGSKGTKRTPEQKMRMRESALARLARTPREQVLRSIAHARSGK